MPSPRLVRIASVRACRLHTILLSSLLAACATQQNSGLRDLPPAPLVVAVKAEQPAAQRGDGLAFVATAAEMQQMLVQELRALDASSRVVTADDPLAADADLEVTFVPGGAVTFEHVGTTNFLGAGGLWLVTWLGGLLVQDSTYSVRWDKSAKFRYACAAASAPGEREVGGGDIDLAFFDRNDLVSFQGLQSLILPPFWTSDQDGKTSATLTRSSLRVAAEQITSLLKKEKDFEALAEGDFKCGIRIDAPANGSAVDSPSMPIVITATPRTRAKVSKVTVAVNGGQPVALELTTVVGAAHQARGTLIGLVPGAENWVRIEVTTDKIHTRTLRLGGRR